MIDFAEPIIILVAIWLSIGVYGLGTWIGNILD